MKKINNKKFSGFTMIELLITIVVISLVGSIATYSIFNSINKSKSTGEGISIDSIKSTGRVYISDKINDVVWISEDDSQEFSCVSVKSLVDYGYFKKSIFKNDFVKETDFIKINRNKNSLAIVSEQLGGDDVNKICNRSVLRYPKCNFLTYNGYEQSLLSIKEKEISKYNLYYNGELVSDISNLQEINAGNYKLSIKLKNSDNIWEDGTKNDKELICKIRPKKLVLRLSKLNLSIDQFNNNYFNKDDSYFDSILNNVNVLATGLIDGHKIKDIDLFKNSNTSIMLSNAFVTESEIYDVTENYNISYLKGALKIAEKIEIPNNSICINPKYTGSPLNLAVVGDNYSLINNIGTDAKEYTLYAVLDENYRWENGDENPIPVKCSILPSPTATVGNCPDKLYNGSSQTLASGGNNVTYSNNEQTAAGTYSVVVNSNPNYTFSDGKTSKTLSCTIKNPTYTVTFDANGGSVSGSATKTVTYTENYGTLSSATRTGYTFSGWYTAASGGSLISNTTKVTTASNHTLYAHWTANTYTVEFDGNGGSITPSDSTKTVTYDQSYGALPGSAARVGYTFLGWYTAASGGSLISSTTKVTTASKHTLYAHWKIQTFTVNFNANGGSASLSSKTVTYNTKVGTLPTAKREGYKFAGWYTEANGGTEITENTVIRSNRTFYALWNGCVISKLECPSSLNYATKADVIIDPKYTCSSVGSSKIKVQIKSSDCAIKSSSGCEASCINNKWVNHDGSQTINAYCYKSGNKKSCSYNSSSCGHTINVRVKLTVGDQTYYSDEKSCTYKVTK